MRLPEPSETLSFARGSDAVPRAGHLTMRKTLRRSCDACARSKLRCDLLLPQCSRCRKSTRACIYANEPLSSLTEGTVSTSTSSSPEPNGTDVRFSPKVSMLNNNPGIQSFDPFNTYPQTRLPRAHVQRLIQHCRCSSLPRSYVLSPLMLIWSSPFNHRLPILPA